MEERTYLGELEQLVLWSALRLDGEGYGATILEELEARIGRRVSTGALYATLDRLEEKGMLEAKVAPPEPSRGGRRKRLMSVTTEGRAALAVVRREWMSMWEGTDVALGTHES